MLRRKPVFPHVIEINLQLEQMIGCNVYLIFEGNEWVLIDIGYEESTDEIIEAVRQLDFPFSKCQALIATHADVDHIQGIAKAKHVFRAPVAAHQMAVHAMKTGDKLETFAEISAQDINMEMPATNVDRILQEGDKISVGRLELEVWSTPGHTKSQLSFRMGNLLFSGDNIFKDGCVGAIDAHHGSDIPSFIDSLQRIHDCDAEWLLPSHGPIFRKDNELITNTIERLKGYSHMADFGTCATDWPLLDEWEKEVNLGKFPKFPS